MKRTVVLWIIIAIAALALNGTFPAGAQEVPVFQDGQWLLPEPESVGMGPDPGYSGGYGGGVEQWRDEVDAACAYHGCSTDYILGVMACESGGDPNAVGQYGEQGLMQIDPMWGTYGPVESIWFAAEHLTAGDIWWACG